MKAVYGYLMKKKNITNVKECKQFMIIMMRTKVITVIANFLHEMHLQRIMVVVSIKANTSPNIQISSCKGFSQRELAIVLELKICMRKCYFIRLNKNPFILDTCGICCKIYCFLYPLGPDTLIHPFSTEMMFVKRLGTTHQPLIILINLNQLTGLLTQITLLLKAVDRN